MPKLPETERAKARVLKGFGGAGIEAPGEVPVEGTPTRGALPERVDAVLPTVSASRQIPRMDDHWVGLEEKGHVVPPPYDPWSLVCAVEESDTLPELIDIMATNLTGYGWELQPRFPTRDQDGSPIPPPEGAEEERDRLETFLEVCDPVEGLGGIMELADRDRETTGNSYTEVLRNVNGDVAQLSHLRSYQMRLGELSTPILVETRRRLRSGKMIAIPSHRRFRTFVQLREGYIRYFKTFGDPRHLNLKTGEYRASDQAPWGADANGNSLDATEVIHRSIYSPHSDYGVPRWIGGTPHVRAARKAGETVVSWFDNAPIGAKLMTIGGGAFVPNSLKEALQKIDHMARGRENAWSIVAVEAEAHAMGDGMNDTRPAPPQINVEDLAYELPASLYSGDGNLLDGGMDRVARMFRIPPVYWGASDDYSRAAVNTARASTEEQVFRPVRSMTWERVFNRQLFPAMGAGFWKFVLVGANTTDDTEVAGNADKFGTAVSPNALIKLWNKITGQDEDPIGEAWGDRPMSLTMALLQAGLDPNAPLEEIAGRFEEDRQRGIDLQEQIAEGAGDDEDDDEDDDRESARKALKLASALLDLPPDPGWRA